MEIELYWDSLFFIDFFANLGVLILLKHKFSIQSAKWRMGCAAMSGAAFYMISCFLPMTAYLCKLFLAVMSVYTMVSIIVPKRKRPIIRKILLSGFLYTFVISGILRVVFLNIRLISGKSVSVIGLLAAILVCVQIAGIYIKSQKLRQTTCVCKAVIENEEQKITVLALIDTGNCLKEPISGKPVCLVEENALDKIILHRTMPFRAIPFHSVGCEHGMLYGIEVSKITVITDETCYVIEQPICAGVHHTLSAKGTYQMILPPSLITK